MGRRARRALGARPTRSHAHVPSGRAEPVGDGHVAARRRRRRAVDWHAGRVVPSSALRRVAAGACGRARWRAARSRAAGRPEGRLWVGHDDGLLVLGPGPTRPDVTTGVRDCGEGRPPDRRLRLPTQAGDACAFTAAGGLIDLRVRALSLGSDGHVRVGTVTGLSDIDGVRITRVSQEQGLAPTRSTRSPRTVTATCGWAPTPAALSGLRRSVSSAISRPTG